MTYNGRETILSVCTKISHPFAKPAARYRRPRCSVLIPSSKRSNGSTRSEKMGIKHQTRPSSTRTLGRKSLRPPKSQDNWKSKARTRRPDWRWLKVGTNSEINLTMRSGSMKRPISRSRWKSRRSRLIQHCHKSETGNPFSRLKPISKKRSSWIRFQARSLRKTNLWLT